jgi:hypothetical protein
MGKRLAVACLVVPAVVLGVAVPQATAGPDAARTVGNCVIVAAPTATHHTRCPGAGLLRAPLAHTNLTSADLHGADLTNADLSGATLTHADLAGANLTGAVLDHAIWNDTTCPDGSSSRADGGTCVDDLMVLEGVAIASTSAAAPSSPAGGAAPTSNAITASSGTTPTTVPGTRRALSSLAFTGARTAVLALMGSGGVLIGLLLILFSGRARRRAPSRPAS